MQQLQQQQQLEVEIRAVTEASIEGRRPVQVEHSPGVGEQDLDGSLDSQTPFEDVRLQRSETTC